MATLKLKNPAAGPASGKRTGPGADKRPPVRGTGSAPKKRPTLSQAQAERDAEEARFQAERRPPRPRDDAPRGRPPAQSPARGRYEGRDDNRNAPRTAFGHDARTAPQNRRPDAPRRDEPRRQDDSRRSAPPAPGGNTAFESRRPPPNEQRFDNEGPPRHDRPFEDRGRPAPQDTRRGPHEDNRGNPWGDNRHDPRRDPRGDPRGAPRPGPRTDDPRHTARHDPRNDPRRDPRQDPRNAPPHDLRRPPRRDEPPRGVEPRGRNDAPPRGPQQHRAESGRPPAFDPRGPQRDPRRSTPRRIDHDDDEDDRPLHAEKPGTLRLSKRMSELGLASRREADEWIEKGWVRVDGRVVNELGSRVLPEQHITIDAKAHNQQAQRVTVLLNKPMGYVSGQAEDGYEPASVLVKAANQWHEDRSGIRFLLSHLRSLAPAGRLDIDSVGLLVLTQDGRIAKQLIGEDSEVEKEYLVRVEPLEVPLSDEGLALLNHGLELDGEALRPAQVEWLNDDQLRFVLREGKKRQIRRMCEAVGLKVVGLKRVRIGSVMLGDLPTGQWRYLRGDESFAEKG